MGGAVCKGGVVCGRRVELDGVCGRGLSVTLCPQELAAQQEEAELERGPAPPGPPNDYKDKYRHLIGSDAAKAAARTMEANKAYGCGEPAHLGPFFGGGGGFPWGHPHLVGLGGVVLGAPGRRGPPSPRLPRVVCVPPVPVANKRDTRSIEEAMNEIRAKKRLRQAEDEGGAGGTSA